jgi:hypothetical protein
MGMGIIRLGDQEEKVHNEYQELYAILVDSEHMSIHRG